MPANVWVCDWDSCQAELPGELAEDNWVQILRPGGGLQYHQGDGSRTIVVEQLVFHTVACMSLWVRKHLIEIRS